MKPTLMKTAQISTALAAALLLVPVPAFAQAAAGAVPNAFDQPAQPGTVQPRPAPAPIGAAQAPDISRAEEALRSVIASAQGSGFDYSVFTTDMASQMRQLSTQVTPLLKGYGDVRTVAFERVEGEAQLFKITFDNQVTEWMIVFDPEDKIAGLRFRPLEE